MSTVLILNHVRTILEEDQPTAVVFACKFLMGWLFTVVGVMATQDTRSAHVAAVAHWYFILVPTLGLFAGLFILYASCVRDREMLEIAMFLSAAEIPAQLSALVNYSIAFASVRGMGVYLFGSVIQAIGAFAFLLTVQKRRRDIKIDQTLLEAEYAAMPQTSTYGSTNVSYQHDGDDE